jgi:hypothetical protein
MNLDWDKIYVKLAAFSEIYNFVVQTFFIWSHLGTQKINILQIRIRTEIWTIYIFLAQADFKWKKFELQSYFCWSRRKLQVSTNFIFIRVHKKKLRFFENTLTFSVTGHDGCMCRSTNRRSPRRLGNVAPATTMAHGGMPLPSWGTAVAV